MKIADEWKWTDISYSEWREAVDVRLFDVYALTIELSGVDDEYLTIHWEMKQSPYAFVEWYGVKYDLTPKGEFDWGEIRSIL